MSNANTTTNQDRVIESAKDFSQRNECCSDQIDNLIAIIEDLDIQISGLKDEVKTLQSI